MAFLTFVCSTTGFVAEDNAGLADLKNWPSAQDDGGLDDELIQRGQGASPGSMRMMVRPAEREGN